MKVVSLHNLGVPCKVKIQQDNSPALVTPVDYYLNPRAIIRYEPDGVVITPPLFYSSFLHGDEEVSVLLKKRYFSSSNLPAAMITALVENQVLSQEKYNSQEQFREFTVGVSGLPTQALLEITSKCNCDCLTCYHKADLGSHMPEYRDLQNRIKKLSELGIRLVEVTGGEPLLRPDLSDILEYIVDCGLYFYLVSNGEYLADIDRRLMSILRDFSLGVAISLDGDETTHDLVRQRPGLYVKLITGMERLSQQGINIYLISTLHEKNVQSVDNMIELAQRFGVSLHLRPTVNAGGAKINDVGELNSGQELKKYFGLPGIRNGFIGTRKQVQESYYYGCGIRWRISVDSRGILYPCVMDRSRFKKIITEYSIAEFVSDLALDTSFFLNQNDECRHCEVNKDGLRCGGFCRFSKHFQSHKRG